METTNTQSPLTPTVSDSYGFGWNQMKKYFLYLFFVTIIMLVAESLTGLSNKPQNISAFGQLMIAAYWLLVLSVVSYGGIYMFLKAARDESFEVVQMFDGFKTNFWNIVLANLLTTILVGIGIVLLIVPGIIIACRLAFVPYLVMDQKMDAVKALEKSWQMTRGHGWTIFFMGLLAIPIALGGLILLGVGIIFSIMWISTSFASMYHAVEQLQGNQNAETVSET